MIADIVLGFAWGDEAKSKVCSSLIKENKYNRTMRFNGSSNAGHTFYLNEQKIITHIVPTGAVFNIRSIIGPGCVINEADFWKEIDHLKQFNHDILNYVKIAHNAHIVQDRHKEEEVGETAIGTTKMGVGPAYRDKYARTGIRAESIDSFKGLLIDVYDEFYKSKEPITLLAEGAQALGLDIDWGTHYPFVTSSHCGVGSLINNGVPHKAIRKVVGVTKCYDTYVGTRAFQNILDPVLDKLADEGQEYGATTGRRRKTNYLNVDLLVRSAQMSCATDIIINKIDVLRKVNVWKVLKGNSILDLGSELSFVNYIRDLLPEIKFVFSNNPYTI